MSSHHTLHRSLAAEAAIQSLIRTRLDPLASSAGIQQRGSIQAIEGSGFYTVLFDNVEVARVTLTSDDSFLFKILLP